MGEIRDSAKNMSYENAPLVELIVETRWRVETIGIPGGPPIVGGSSPDFDTWFQRVANALRDDGFQELERLTPHDIPPFVHQPIFRFKKTGSQFPVYQLGHGIFSIHAGPPGYVSWEDFRPQVKAGLQILIDCMPGKNSQTGFSTTSLRYLDVFKEDLRERNSNYAFMRDVLGVSINMPEELLCAAKDQNQISPIFVLDIPISEEGGRLRFELAAGQIGNRPDTDTIMDITYAVNRSLEANAEQLLLILDKGHRLTHRWFTRLTEKIHEKMKPVNMNSGEA